VIPIVVTVGGVAVAGAIIIVCYATKCTAVTKVGSILNSVREHLISSY